MRTPRAIGDSMKESSERVVKVGLTRNPKKVFDQVDSVTAEMVRQGWVLTDTVMEDGLAKIHLFFERDILELPTAPQ